jgi:hypothetical protein
MPKKKGKWFEGDVFSMPSNTFTATRKFEKGVMKPTALETKIIRGKVFSRYYHKPVKPGELY